MHAGCTLITRRQWNCNAEQGDVKELTPAGAGGLSALECPFCCAATGCSSLGSEGTVLGFEPGVAGG